MEVIGRYDTIISNTGSTLKLINFTLDYEVVQRVQIVYAEILYMYPYTNKY